MHRQLKKNGRRVQKKAHKANYTWKFIYILCIIITIKNNRIKRKREERGKNREKRKGDETGEERESAVLGLALIQPAVCPES